MKSNATVMTQGKPATLLLRFALPMLVGNLFQQAHNMVASLVVGNFIGTEALASVSIANYPQRVLLALFIGLGTGATIRISQYAGANDGQGVRRVVQTANGLILLVTLPTMAVGILLAGPVLRAMNTPPEAFDGAYVYLTILYLGALGMLGFNLNAGILRGLGDSRSPVLFLMIATLVNIALNLLFVAVFGLGVAGVAAASVIAYFTAWGFSVFYIKRQYPQYAVKLLPVRIDKTALGDVLRLGLPIGLNDSLFSLGHLTLSSVVNSHGTSFAAGYSVGTTIDSLSFMPLMSFAAAMATYTGQNMGARQYDRIRQGTRAALTIMICWNVFACAMMVTFGWSMISLFNRDPQVIEVGYAYILRLEPFYWMYAIMFILNAVLNGVGEVRVPMIANLVLFWAIRLPAAYLLTAHAHPNNLFFCFPISWLAGTLISATYYFSGRWKRRFDESPAPG